MTSDFNNFPRPDRPARSWQGGAAIVSGAGLIKRKDEVMRAIVIEFEVLKSAVVALSVVLLVAGAAAELVGLVVRWMR